MISTSGEPCASTAATTSSTDILRPSWNAYGVSHQLQRRSQAVSRTKTHELPGAGRLALNRMEDLVDRQHRRFLLSYRLWRKPTFYYETHVNDLQERQKFSGYGRRRRSNQIDINKEPPPRAFLEKHIDPERFLDFVSTRSPVFKERPLPRSKKEAIALMMENPNLIRRPIMIKGSKVIFGFDKDQYGTL